MKQIISKLFSRVAAVAAVALLTAATAWGETSTVTASKVTSSSVTWTGSAGESWSVSVTGGATNQNLINSYAQVGSKNSPSTSITLSTNGISGTITSIVIDCASYNGLGTVSATVGGSAFGTQSQSTPSWSNNSGGNVTFTGSASGGIVLTMTNGTNGRAMYIKSITVTYSASTMPISDMPTFSPAAGTYTSPQNVTISTTTAGATIYYTTNGDDPTTSSSVYSSAINVSETTTIKAIAVKSGYDNSPIAAATYTIVSLEHAGTMADPYTVADARTAIDANVGLTDVYATGIVSSIVTPYNSQYGNVSFDFVDENGDVVSLRAYRCVGDDAANVTVGDVVVVKGNLTKYGSTYEFAEGCELVSLTHPVVPSITVDLSSINVSYARSNGTISVSYNNISEVAAAVAFYAADGTTTATYDWIAAEIDSDNNVEYVIEENSGSESRTAYLKVWAYDDDLQAVYSDLITVSQERYVADYATLPFEFDGGRSDIADTEGLSQSGLGSDYNDAPVLKFDTTDDWLLLKFNERPGILSFYIKGNSFSGGTFKVQTSADGETFSDLKTYTSISGSSSYEEINSLAADVRYIKWVYTTKASGNVGLGTIKLEEYVAPDPYITITPEEVNCAATDVEGTLEISFEGLSVSDMQDFDIAFFDPIDGNPIGQPDWIEVLVAEQDPSVGQGYVVSYTMSENEGDARSVSFQVYALDEEATEVYSNFVTINQAAPVRDYATLPFEFWGGKSDIATTNGLTQEGLDSDYANAPKLKFNTTGDWLILKFNEAPGVLTFDIKGNSFSGGTFTVQTSADGEIYTDLEAYTDLDDTQSEVFDNLPESVRFIRWIYTEKSNGNVALGDITLSRKVAAPDTYDLTLAAGDGGCWGTFYNGVADYQLPEGAQAFTMNVNKQLYRLGSNGRVIPAGTAVVIIADVEVVTLTKGGSPEAVAVNGGDNILLGDDFPVEATGNECVLGKKNNAIGFFNFTGTSIPANKAYYVVSE